MQPEGLERVMEPNDLIVSKTDLKGRVTYANDTFLEIAEMRLPEVLDKQHSLVRSRAMPRCVFKLLWDKIQAGHEVFAYVVNKTGRDNHYWVFAHVTPSFGADGKITGYHSNRRKPTPAAIEKIKQLYDVLLAEEGRHKNGKQALAASSALLGSILEEKGVDYDEFVLNL